MRHSDCTWTDEPWVSRKLRGRENRLVQTVDTVDIEFKTAFVASGKFSLRQHSDYCHVQCPTTIRFITMDNS